nr:hypothetical protein [Anaerolineae bacterium]
MKRKPGMYKYEQTLATAFDFTEEDLAANQRGEVTPRQIEILTKKRNQNRWLTLFSGVVLAFMVMGGLVALFVFPPFGIIFLAILAYIGRTVFKQLNAFEQDLKTPQVEVVEGIVNLDIRRSTRTTTTGNTSSTKTSISYSVQIGDQTFTVNEKVFLTFKNGDPYAIYFTPFAKTILSVDWLRDDD